ncbi:hypothetical protein A9Q84_11035 [Halobacteriovorax marinus]|uniref:Lipoprotein n=1 Tax=Halobacteriovorax marinus TaxID=97084 RepID=A0A1Y5F7L0_9BACT|nr:hypothetical protein A9Q84_11035 [Halobacteriovorax marinus]
MKLLIPILFLSLVLTSCKGEKDKKDENSDERFNFNKEISPERTLTDSEFAVVKSLCTDLQTKRIYFEARGDRELEFTYNLTNTNCSGVSSVPGDYVATLRVSISGDLEIEGPRGQIFADDVLTDVHPSILSICTDVLSGTNVSNTRTVGALKYQYRFLKADNYILEVAKFAQNVDGLYIPTFIESFSVLSSVFGSKTGMVFDRIQVTQCSNGKAKSNRQFLK